MVHGAKQHGNYGLSRLEQVFTAHILQTPQQNVQNAFSATIFKSQLKIHRVWKKNTPFVFFLYLKKLCGYFHNLWHAPS